MSSTRSIAPARRAIVRWAWRLFRREWRAQLLVLCLATIAVGAAITAATMAVRAGTDPAGRFGNGGGVAHLDVRRPAETLATVEGLAARFGSVQQIDHELAPVAGAREAVDVRAFDPNQDLVAPMIGLLAGRYPTTSDEIALTTGVAALLDARVGDSITLARVDRTVVGLVENPARLSDGFGLVVPGSIATPTGVDVLIADPSRRIETGPSEVRATIMLRGSDDASGRLGLVAVVIAVAMSLVGLIAAAGFLVVAQRRQRQLGLLAAIGASRQHLRMVMLANGAFVGAIASVLGAAVGVLGWIAVRPSIESSADHRLGRLDLPWGIVGITMLLGLLTGTLAAWWPARTAGRVPVMTALSGRPPQPRALRRPVLLAIAIIAAGMGAIAEAGPTRPRPKVPLLVAGLLAIVLGVVLATPGAIRAAAVSAPRLPLPARLAVRDLARFRARSAASLAAVTMGLGIAVGVVVIAGANASQPSTPNLAPNQVLVHANGDDGGGPEAAPTARATVLDAQAASVIAALGERTAMVPLDVAVGVGSTLPILVGRPIDEHSTEMVGPAYVATSDVLAAVGIDPATIRADADVLTSRTERLRIVDPARRNDTIATVEHATLPPFTAGPSMLITPTAMQRNGWRSQRFGWLITLPRPPTAAELHEARTAAAQIGFVVELPDTPGDATAVQDAATLIGAATALLIIVTTIGLLRSESAGDVRTLTANGAPRRTRRAIAASTATTMGVLGVLLAVGGAYLASIAAFRADLGRLSPVPWPQLLGIAIGVPLLATVLAWLAAGREPPMIARRALD